MSGNWQRVAHTHRPRISNHHLWWPMSFSVGCCSCRANGHQSIRPALTISSLVIASRWIFSPVDSLFMTILLRPVTYWHYPKLTMSWLLFFDQDNSSHGKWIYRRHFVCAVSPVSLDKSQHQGMLQIKYTSLLYSTWQIDFIVACPKRRQMNSWKSVRQT